MKHGGDLTDAIAQFGGTAEDWLDLSTGINPWPWPIPTTIPQRAWRRLPQRADEIALIEAARASYGVRDGVDIALAAGSQALIRLLPHLMNKRTVAIAGPTYGEHEIAFGLAGRPVVVSDPARFPKHASHGVIVNPNNPDGRIVDHERIIEIARAVNARGGWLIVDEAFADVEPECSAIPLCRELPIIVLRSFGKFFGLAGLRLGFAIAQPTIIRRIVAAIGPWPVSGPALVIGSAALKDYAWIVQTRERLAEQAGKLDAALTAAGFEIAGGISLFRLARHRDAVSIHEKLARKQIWARRFDHASDLLRFGLPPDDAALARLAAALRKQT